MDDHRWETEAMRDSRARRGGRPTVSQRQRTATIEPPVWVTLREASDATGIPVGTLGSWARRGTVDSYLEGNGGRTLRIVDLNTVRGRAHDLGRPIAPVPVRAVEAPSAAEPPSTPAAPLTPTGGESLETMIVPIDAWNKMLNQLGNLHEAGQQLSEARERAAKAETEAAFLRERLAELREEPAAADPAPEPAPPSGDGSEPWMPEELEAPPAAEPEAEPAPRFWRSLFDSWKSRRR